MCFRAEFFIELKGGKIPERALYIRVIMGELERLHSHFLYLAHGCEVLGHETFSMRIFYMRETIMDLLHMVGGNRVQYGCSIIGGVRPRCDLDEFKLIKITEGLDTTEKNLKEFADRTGADFYILPSSIHETLLIPVADNMELDYLTSMVREVNATQVTPEEQLSDNVYIYRRATDSIELA